MQFTKTIISLASLASLSTAAALPQTFTGTSNWWYWTITNLTITSPPSSSTHNYNFDIQYFSQATKASCSGVRETNTITCSDSAYSINTTLSGSPFTITQKLYQTGAIAVLSGNTTINTTCSMKQVGSSICNSPAFKVDAYLVDTILP